MIKIEAILLTSNDLIDDKTTFENVNLQSFKNNSISILEIERATMILFSDYRERNIKTKILKSRFTDTGTIEDKMRKKLKELLEKI